MQQRNLKRHPILIFHTKAWEWAVFISQQNTSPCEKASRTLYRLGCVVLVFVIFVIDEFLFFWFCSKKYQYLSRILKKAAAHTDRCHCRSTRRGVRPAVVCGQQRRKGGLQGRWTGHSATLQG